MTRAAASWTDADAIDNLPSVVLGVYDEQRIGAEVVGNIEPTRRLHNSLMGTGDGLAGPEGILVGVERLEEIELAIANVPDGNVAVGTRWKT
jgi:hypothetical protein